MKSNTISTILFIIIFSTNSLYPGILDSTQLFLPHKGSAALDFGMSGLFSFHHFKGHSVAYKKFSSNNTAKRFAADIYVNGYNQEGLIWTEQYYEYQDTTIQIDQTIDNEYRRNNVMLMYQWIKYSIPYHKASFFYGFGPILGIIFTGSERINDYSVSSSNSYIDRVTISINATLYSGISPCIGVEFFLNPNFSFHAEYSTNIKLGWKIDRSEVEWEQTDGDWKKSQSNTEGLYFDIRSRTWAGVSFYFK